MIYIRYSTKKQKELYLSTVDQRMNKNQFINSLNY